MSGRPWRVVITRPAERELRRLPADVAARLTGPIAALGLDRRPPGCEKIVGTDVWRIRVGPLRVVCAVDPAPESVLILRVARRSESTYRLRP